MSLLGRGVDCLVVCGHGHRAFRRLYGRVDFLALICLRPGCGAPAEAWPLPPVR